MKKTLTAMMNDTGRGEKGWRGLFEWEQRDGRWAYGRGPEQYGPFSSTVGAYTAACSVLIMLPQLSSS